MKIHFYNPLTLFTPPSYSQAASVSGGRTIHVSGQVAFNATGEVVGKGAQVQQVYENLAAALAAAGLLVVLMPSRVNIGLRHALAVYPFLAVVAACGALDLWRWGRPRLVAVAVGALVGWQLAGTIRAAPDFLPWFNELAGPAPERIVVDSDLDWGQDLKRMADTLRTRGITNPLLAYNGSADPAAVGIERYRILRPFTPDTGWIAISVYTRTLGYWNEPTSDDFAWLEAYQPVARAGRSMLLYRIEAASESKR
jgi:hypothetical protein